jgi:hypothetical protein
MALIKDLATIKFRPPMPLHDMLRASSAPLACTDQHAVRQEESSMLEILRQLSSFVGSIESCTVVDD